MAHAFEHIIGIVGHPTTPDVAWSDAQMEAMRDVGFDTLQLSIAWAWRPAGEVLNLEHLDEPGHRAEFHRRIAKAREFGFRTLGHFGLPVGPTADATTCILDPEVRADYATRMTAFFQDFDADAVMVYTYDQLAWLCSEFGDCPRCQGIPLHERLIPFLELLVAAVQEGKPGARLWWEPWELSEGQVLTVIDQIEPDHFGLILHNTIAEVQFVNTTDLAFRNMARSAGERGIPVIGEAFLGGSGEDVSPLTHLACPRLVFQQLEALRLAEGVVGIKEYYGMAPAEFSVNVRLLSAYLREPGADLDVLLTPIAASYGAEAASVLLEAWEATARAMELFPWNASWRLRRIFEAGPDEEWRTVPGAEWMTPSWQANRRGFYMVTGSAPQHPWLREDVGMRASFAAREFDRAAGLLAEAEAEATRDVEDILHQRLDIELAASIAGRLGRDLLDHRSDPWHTAQA